MTTYTGPTVYYDIPRDTSPATTSTTMTWLVHVMAPIQLSSLVMDLRSAADYSLKINGTTVATVTGVTAGQTGVTFTPSSTQELTQGTYTFQLVSSVANVTWYARGNFAAVTAPSTASAGHRYLSFGVWQEGGTTSLVPAKINFVVGDNYGTAYVESSTNSSGSFAAMTWTATFSIPVTLVAIAKELRISDTYTLTVDGTVRATIAAVPSGLTTFNVGTWHVLALSSPLSLSAGSHTFSIAGTASRQVYYRAGTTAVPAGDAATTAWGVWQESTGNQVPARLFYATDSAATASRAGGVQANVALSEIAGVQSQVGGILSQTAISEVDGVTVNIGGNLVQVAVQKKIGYVTDFEGHPLMIWDGSTRREVQIML